MKQFSTIDIYGKSQTFQYLIDMNELDNEVTFRVFSIPKDEMRWFSYRVKKLSNNLAKSDHMTSNNCSEFAKKGIPETIIQIASEELNRDIQSSPITFHNGNYLTPASKKAWERLVNENKNALIDIERDCFHFTKVEKI